MNQKSIFHASLHFFYKIRHLKYTYFLQDGGLQVCSRFFFLVFDLSWIYVARFCWSDGEHMPRHVQAPFTTIPCSEKVKDVSNKTENIFGGYEIILNSNSSVCQPEVSVEWNIFDGNWNELLGFSQYFPDDSSLHVTEVISLFPYQLVNLN